MRSGWRGRAALRILARMSAAPASWLTGIVRINERWIAGPSTTLRYVHAMPRAGQIHYEASRTDAPDFVRVFPISHVTNAAIEGLGMLAVVHFGLGVEVDSRSRP